MTWPLDRDRREPRASGGSDRGWGRLSLWLPGAVMVTSLVGLMFYCHGLLSAAAAGQHVVIGGVGFWLSVGTFFAACVAAVLLHCVRITNRVTGPELRLCRALQRIRSRDVGFRISLRRGDLLTGLARECNELLEWLNQNPPAGVRTGGDVVEVPAEPVVADVVNERGHA